MKLNEKLHIVVPIYEGDDEASTICAYVHSAPISREVFEAHFMLLSKTFAAIFAEGLGAVAGPRVASMLMRKVAEQQRDEAGAMALMNELRRLSNVLVRGDGGWTMIPFQDAIDSGKINADDLSEVENSLVFFTVAWVMFRRQTRQETLAGAASLWGALITSLTATGFAASLRTSIATVSSGETPIPASSAVF